MLGERGGGAADLWVAPIRVLVEQMIYVTVLINSALPVLVPYFLLAVCMSSCTRAGGFFEENLPYVREVLERAWRSTLFSPLLVTSGPSFLPTLCLRHARADGPRPHGPKLDRGVAGAPGAQMGPSQY